MSLKVAINGFGRIGRNVLRAAGKSGADIDFVAVNDLTDARTLGHLLKYDSVHGRFDGTVEVGDAVLTVNGDKIKVLSERDPAKLPWKELADVVVEKQKPSSQTLNPDSHSYLNERLRLLEQEAVKELEGEGFAAHQITVYRYLDLSVQGTDTRLPVDEESAARRQMT